MEPPGCLVQPAHALPPPTLCVVYSPAVDAAAGANGAAGTLVLSSDHIRFASFGMGQPCVQQLHGGSLQHPF